MKTGDSLKAGARNDTDSAANIAFINGNLKEGRADGHLFITVLAYQLVQFLRVGLKAAGIFDSWAL